MYHYDLKPFEKCIPDTKVHVMPHLKSPRFESHKQRAINANDYRN